MLTILFISFLTLLIILWIKGTSKPPNFPPGPPRVPIIGSDGEMKNPWGSKPSIFWGIVQLEKKYGDIFGLYLGNLRTVVLTRYEDIKEVFNMDEASGRPPTNPVNIRPGWQYPEESDPIMNKDRPPGVILSSVSSVIIFKLIVFLNFSVPFGNSYLMYYVFDRELCLKVL